MRIEKLDDDLVVRLPAALVKALALAEGDELLIVDDEGVSIQESPGKRLETFIEKMRAEGKLLPSGYKFKRADAYEGTNRY
jgi:antitoxin component of MazEF toxin-antitoxin module